MTFLLDTNVISLHLRRTAGLTHRFNQHSGRLYTSSLCLSELFVWAYRRPNPAPFLQAINDLLYYEVGVLDFDRDCAAEFGRIRAQLRSRGIEIPTVDLMIASVALVFGLTLVTNNTSDFHRIPDLVLEDWL